MTRKVLRQRDSIPGREWAAFIAGTGATITAASRGQLIPKVCAHLRANNLPAMLVPEEDIDSYICAAMSEGQQARRCKFVSVGETPPEVVTVGINDAYDFVNFVRHNGFSFVGGVEATRRAAICAQCPWNVPMAQHCPACESYKLLTGAVEAVVGARTTPHDAKLKNCGICHCYNRVKVHVNIDKDYRPGREFPSWCWQNPSNL